MSLSQNVRVLLVEDEPNDAELIAYRLRQAGLVFSYQRVRTCDSLIAALDQFEPAIVLCDSGLPTFNAASAIRTVAEKRPGLPVVVVTGTLGDEEAVRLVKTGACDYVRKDRLVRLPVAVMNALAAAQSRRIQERHEAAIKASELRYRRRFETATDGILVADAATRRIYDVNPSLVKLLGFSRDECCGQTLTEFGLIDADNNLPLETLLATGDYYRRPVLKLDSKDGRQVDVEFTAVAFKVGTEVTIQCNLRDITERTYFEAALREKNRELEAASLAKDRFLASMSHELRTPLHGILGYAELMSLENDLNTTQSERLEAMLASGQHLLGMINATLDMSRIEADELELLPADIDLPDLVRTCLNVVRPAADAKGLALGPAPSVPRRLFADPTRVRQVLINLLGNAVKFTLTGSVEVRIRQTEGGACIRLEVVDTGPGIRLRHRDKLFQTFERLNADADSGVEGAGLGLAIAARLVQLMGGRIGYLDNPGGGSVFWLELPAYEHLLAAKNEADTLALDERPRLRVLVVDDEALNRSIASGFLSKAGHEVVCVNNGEAAIEAATAGGFDVILMDVRMPGMNGMEATREIRRLPGPRGAVRVVAVTAQAFAQQIEMCRQAGMDGHVSKPFKQAVLLAALETVEITQGGPPLAGLPPAEATPEAGLELPAFDPDTFEDIAQGLSATDLEECLQTLVARCEALLLELCRPGMLAQASALVDDVHRLAGGAGTLGFLSIAAAARQFEIAADTGGVDMAACADRLATAIEASMPIIRKTVFRGKRCGVGTLRHGAAL